MGRLETRKNNGVGYTPLGVWLFLCPKSNLSTLKNLPLWWGRLLEQFRYTASQTNFFPHRPKLETLRGGLSLNNGASRMATHTQNPINQNTLTLSVSHIKQQSLQKQYEIIRHALAIFCIDSTQDNLHSLKNNVLKLARMLDEIKDTQLKPLAPIAKYHLEKRGI